MKPLWSLLVALGALLAASCAGDGGTPAKVGVPETAGRLKTSAIERAKRRLFDGAPPVIPHAPMGVNCTSCHNERGLEVPNLGFAPPTPHEHSTGMSAMSRCTQCHVFQKSKDAIFKANNFVGLRQDLRSGERFAMGAPPLLPHRVQMRENCVACHSGKAAREEIRCDHPERTRCLQCHVEAQSSKGHFSR